MSISPLKIKLHSSDVFITSALSGLLFSTVEYFFMVTGIQSLALCHTFLDGEG